MRVSRFFVGAPGRPETLFRLVFFMRHPSFGGGHGPLRGHHWKGPGCSGLPGPAISAPSSGALGALLAASIGQVPRILDTRTNATRGHHALLERGEGTRSTVIAVVAAILDAPGPIDFRGGRLDIYCERDRRQHGERDASWPTHGREWAEQHADYDELRRLSELKEEAIGVDPLKALARAVDPDNQLDSLKEYCFGDSDADVSGAYISAFIAGAVGLFNEVAHKL